MAHKMKPNVKLWLLSLPIFLYSFLKELLKGSWKLKNFLQHLKYELSYDILNLDKFEAQKPDTPPPPPPSPPLVK